MTGIDQFESAFRATLRQEFELAPPVFEKILVITDEEADPDQGRKMLSSAMALFPSAAELELHMLTMDAPIAATLELVAEKAPDLVVTHRGLASPSWRQPYTIGENLEVLTQVAAPPVLALAHPLIATPRMDAPRKVLALTEELAGNSDLVNAALALTPEDGQLVLCHVENTRSFERFLDVIAKLPSIDTKRAREEISARLAKEPTDFAKSVSDKLAASAASGAAPEVTVHITRGAHTRDYVELVELEAPDLVVMGTRDADQLAMHGMAHALAIELGTMPMLLL